MDRKALRPLEWVGSSTEDVRGFPADAQDHVGFALYQAQVGREIDLVRRRLKAAEQHYKAKYGEG